MYNDRDNARVKKKFQNLFMELTLSMKENYHIHLIAFR